MNGNILLPNEDGVLVPVTAAEELDATLSETEKALSLAVNSGGSGLGMSYYSGAAKCGRRARLSQERYQSFRDSNATLPPTKNHFIVGSVFHKLHELARINEVDPFATPPTLDADEQYKNPNVAEGMRLYRGWLRQWTLGFWGKTIAVEEHLTDEETFAPASVTAAIDMVVELDEAACERALTRGLDLKPGIYLCDWKTADGPSDGTQYREGLQALWYPYVWQKFNPDKPPLGTIFDVTMKRSRRKDRSVLRDDFQAFFVPYGLESVETLRGMVMQGYRNVQEDVPNRAECCDWRGEVCPFRVMGTCDAT